MTLALIFPLLVPVLFGGCGMAPPDNAYQPIPLPEVTVARPVQQTVTLFIEENGETEATENAEVRARVRGILEEIRFEPGQEVHEGDVLYVIEQAEYIAKVNSGNAAVEAAKAAVQVSESQVGVVSVEVTRAEADFKRYEELLKKQAVAQSQYDEAVAARDAAVATRNAAVATVADSKAQLEQATANLARVQLDLDYTHVKAPISGRISKTAVKRGNLVESGSLLSTIIDRKQIYANFNISDRAALRLKKASMEQRGTNQREGRDYRTVPAYLRRELDKGFPFVGHLDYIDAKGVDQATGTLALRAVFENSNDLIYPGLFVRVRVPISKQENALLIPESAVSKDQRGSFVLVVNADKKVERQSVTTGQSYDGMIVMEEGVDADDWVVLEGAQRARPGAEVNTEKKILSKARILGDQSSDAENTEETSRTSAAEDNAKNADSQP